MSLLQDTNKDYRDMLMAEKLVNLRNSARKRNIDFDLNLTSMRNLLNANQCYFTGTKLNRENFSVDRICASQGYVKGNVVACDKDFNSKKANLTLSELESIYNRLKRAKKL